MYNFGIDNKKFYLSFSNDNHSSKIYLNENNFLLKIRDILSNLKDNNHSNNKKLLIEIYYLLYKSDSNNPHYYSCNDLVESIDEYLTHDKVDNKQFNKLINILNTNNLNTKYLA